MSTELLALAAEMVAIYIIEPTERVVLLRRLRELAVADAWSELLPAIDRLLALDEKTVAQIVAREAAARSSSTIHQLDKGGERSVSNLHKALTAQVDLHPVQVAAIETALFDKGVRYYVAVPNAQQVALVGELVRRLRADFASEIATLGLQPQIDQVAATNDALEAELATAIPDVPAFAPIREAARLGQQQLCVIVAHILGANLDQSEAGFARQARILAPLLELQLELASRAKKRKTSTTEPTPAPAE